MTVGQIILVIVLALVAVVVIANWKRVVALGHWARRYYDEVKVEMKKTAWPTRDSVINNTVMVLITTLAMVVVIGIADRIFGGVVALIFTT